MLRLLEQHSLPTLKQAVQHALKIRATHADALRLIIEHQQEELIAVFCLDGRPHLKLIRIHKTDVSAYQSLMNRRKTMKITETKSTVDAACSS